jgi:hypothetical protein
MRWAKHITHKRNMKNAYKVLIIEALGINGKIIQGEHKNSP